MIWTLSTALRKAYYDSQGREEGRWGMRQGATHRGVDIKGHSWETLSLMPRAFSPVTRVPGLEMR